MDDKMPVALSPDDIEISVLEINEGIFTYVLRIQASKSLALTVESIDKYSDVELCKQMAREMLSDCTTDMKISGRITNNFH